MEGKLEKINQNILMVTLSTHTPVSTLNLRVAHKNFPSTYDD